MNDQSNLQQFRLKYQPTLPLLLKDPSSLNVAVQNDQSFKLSSTDQSEIEKIFPKTKGQPFLTFIKSVKKDHRPIKVGVVFSGGQAAGGHNVISGLFDALKKLNSSSQLYGFLQGPIGIIDNKWIEITEDKLASYRNMGGFDLIGSGRTKIETEPQFLAAEKTIRDLDLEGLVIIGGDDSNTNAAFLAEFFQAKGLKTKVVGVPKTIDGDLKNQFLEISFGFDTACKTYSDTIGSILRDSLSAGKYYFFIKVMGRSASHIALECALQTHPNKTLIGEEIESKKLTLNQVVSDICDMIVERAKQKKDYGVVVIPEGVIEFIPECKILIQELNGLSDQLETYSTAEEKTAFIKKKLSSEATACFNSLPEEIQKQLLLDRDPHGNVQVSKIETERLFVDKVTQELKERSKQGNYKGKFNAQPLFCGYEGRSCYPSNFDAQYCYGLGYVAALLIDNGKTGYMAALRNLAEPVNNWEPLGIPLAGMLAFENRKGKQKTVIKKALVDLNGAVFAKFAAQRDGWKGEDQFRYPGSIQFAGPSELTERTTMTLQLESEERKSKTIIEEEPRNFYQTSSTGY